MYEKEFGRVLSASRNNSLTFFVGAGISRVSGAPMWYELIDLMCEKINEKKRGDYTYEECLRIPQIYYSSLSKEKRKEYFETVENAINSKKLLPNIVHKEMLSLNPVSFITTNYDSLLEDAVANYCQMFKVISRDNDVPSISGDRYILKMHGDFKYKNFVLREEDYLNYSEKFKLIETMVKSIFATNTVVFIGYRLNDYNIKLILNWAKELLKSDFREPIFLYTDDKELTQFELNYHKSKGVSVVEWQKLDNRDASFPGRYTSFFEAIRKSDAFECNEKNVDDSFRSLFYLLEPLDSLSALRCEDIYQKIAQFKVSVVSGSIRTWNDSRLLTRFIEIDKMSPEEKANLDEEIIHMYEVIKSVLAKACIYWIQDDNDIYKINHSNLEFADPRCILFDFKSMNDFVKNDYKTLGKRYTKAFYLYKLWRYDEALCLFLEIARESFSKGEYLYFYFARANCISLKKVVHGYNKYYKRFDVLEDDIPDENQIGDLFKKLPYEFRYSYDSLKDIHSSSLLYRYAYNAFESAQKVDEIIETNSIEYGVSASEKAISRINDYLNFIQGNCLTVDIFAEYKNAVKRIMESIIHKYAIQDKKEVLVDHLASDMQDTVLLDEIDFYCFVECFSDKEISRLFRKYSVSLIKFIDNNKIEWAIRNIIDYYAIAQNQNDRIEVLLGLQKKIKNILILLRYIDISQELFEDICSFILTNEFREIGINEKVNFLDNQINSKDQKSEKVLKTIETTLLSYIDKNFEALKNGDKFEVPSTDLRITYKTLACYLVLNNKDYVSRGLSIRVRTLMESDYRPLLSAHYFNHISHEQQKKFIKWAEEVIEKDFDFGLFEMLIKHEYKIKKAIKIQLLQHLRKEKEKDDKGIPIYVFPRPKKYEHIIQVGYWCFLEMIDTSELSEFIGISDEFDFLYSYVDFSYDKFDVRWLFSLTELGLKKLSNNTEVAGKIRKCIAQSVKTNDYSKFDNDRLKEYLVNYFC